MVFCTQHPNVGQTFCEGSVDFCLLCLKLADFNLTFLDSLHWDAAETLWEVSRGSLDLIWPKKLEAVEGYFAHDFITLDQY